jgi:hypothetical protein
LVERVVGDEDVRHHESVRGCDADDVQAVAQHFEPIADMQAVPFRERRAEDDFVVGGGGTAGADRPWPALFAGDGADEVGGDLLPVQLRDEIRGTDGSGPGHVGIRFDGRKSRDRQRARPRRQVAYAGLKDVQVGSGLVDVDARLVLDPGPHAVEQQDEHDGQSDADDAREQPTCVGEEVAAAERNALHLTALLAKRRGLRAAAPGASAAPSQSHHPTDRRGDFAEARRAVIVGVRDAMLEVVVLPGRVPAYETYCRLR